MFQFLNRLTQVTSGKRAGVRRKSHRISLPVAACESLEDRRLLTGAGIATSASVIRAAGEISVQFDVNWQPTDPATADSVGMNLRIHYDSSAVQLESLSSIYQPGLEAQQDVAETDDVDDGDAATDRVVKLLWVDLDGTWPALPAGSTLLTSQWQTKTGYGQTRFNIDAAGVADAPLPRRQVTISQTPALTGPSTINTVARPTISWTPVDGADHYDVWISQGTTNAAIYLRSDSATNQFTPDTDLELGRYRVWVQAIDTDGAELGWSSPRTFEVRTIGTIQQPSGRITTANPVIQWLPVAGATRYDVWVDNVTTGQRQIIREQNVTATQLAVSSALPLGNYRVWVRGGNAASFWGFWSTPVNFTVATTPANLAPDNPTFQIRPTFTWSTVPGADRYDLWVRNLTTGQSQTIREQNLLTNSFRPVTNLPAGDYAWWVRAISNAGINGQWSPARFSVGGRPQIIAPTGTISSSRPSFQWTPVTGAARYDLWVDQIGGTSQIIRERTLTTNSFTPTSDLPSGTYRFWVQAVTGTGTLSFWSAPRTFTIS